MSARTPKIPDDAPVEEPADDVERPGSVTVRNRSGHRERAVVNRRSGRTDRVFNEREMAEFLAAVVGGCVDESVRHKRGRSRSGAPSSGGTGLLECEMKRRAFSESGFREGAPGGDHQMDSPTGEGVAAKSPKAETFGGLGNSDVKAKESGKEWPRKHSGGIAMGGPPGGQGGDHESSHGTASDGYTKKIGKEWPRAQKNVGGGVAEPFGNDHEGELEDGDAPDGFGAPESEGGDYEAAETVGEGWSVADVAGLMEDNSFAVDQLQGLFDAYARQASYVTLEEFARLLSAHGAEHVMDESNLLTLMGNNDEFMFHELEDASGRYWLGESLDKGGKPWEKKPKKGDKKPAKKGGTPPFAKSESVTTADHDALCREWLGTAGEVEAALTEGKITPETAARALQTSFNVRLTRQNVRECASPTHAALAAVAGRHGLRVDGALQSLKEGFGPPQTPGAGPAGPGPAPGLGGASGRDPNDPMAGLDGQDPDAGLFPDAPDYAEDGGPMGAGGDLEGAGAGLEGQAAALPFDEFEDDGLDGEGFDDPGYDPTPAGDTWGSRAGGSYGDDPVGDAMAHYRQHGPSGGGQVTGSDLPGGGAGIGRRPTPGGPPPPTGGYQESRRRPRRAVSEDGLKGAGHRMDRVGKSEAVTGEVGSDSGLPEDDTDTVEVKGKDLLGAGQTNSGDGQTAFTKGGCGKMTGADGLKENVSKLASAVRRSLAEDDHGLDGKYSVGFTAILDTGGKLSRGPRRVGLTEALADVEELILTCGKSRVTLEAAYESDGSVVRRSRFAMPGVRHRAPLTSDGAVIFRFAESAERFAQGLLAEGAACRVVKHNWGTAVTSKVTVRAVHRAFRGILAK